MRLSSAIRTMAVAGLSLLLAGWVVPPCTGGASCCVLGDAASSACHTSASLVPATDCCPGQATSATLDLPLSNQAVPALVPLVTVEAMPPPLVRLAAGASHDAGRWPIDRCTLYSCLLN